MTIQTMKVATRNKETGEYTVTELGGSEVLMRCTDCGSEEATRMTLIQKWLNRPQHTYKVALSFGGLVLTLPDVIAETSQAAKEQARKGIVAKGWPANLFEIIVVRASE